MDGGAAADARRAAVPAGLTALVAGAAAALAPGPALAAAGALVVLLVVVAAAPVLLLAFVAAAPWDDALPYPSATISVVKILGGLLVLGWAIRVIWRSERLRLAPTLPAAVTFAGLALLSLAVSADPGAGARSTVRELLFVGFFVLFTQLVRTVAEGRRVVVVLVLSATAAGLAGLATFAASGIALAGGPIADPNDFAFVLATTLPFALHLAAVDRRNRPLWAACVVVLVAAVACTLSRGAFVGLGALAVWAVATGRVGVRGVLATGVVAACLVAAALALWHPLIDEKIRAKGAVAAENVASRGALWSGALAMAADQPVLGVGTGQFGVRAGDYVHNEPLGIRRPLVHDSYLEVLAESGLPALLAFVAFLAGSFRLAATGRRRAAARGDADGAGLASAVQAALVVAIVGAAFLSVEVALPLWLLGGLAVTVSGRP